MAIKTIRLHKVPCGVGTPEGSYFGSQVIEENQRLKILITNLAPTESHKPQGYKASRKRKALREG